jgi:hypothetical protein
MNPELFLEACFDGDTATIRSYLDADDFDPNQLVTIPDNSKYRNPHTHNHFWWLHYSQIEMTGLHVACVKETHQSCSCESTNAIKMLLDDPRIRIDIGFFVGLKFPTYAVDWLFHAKQINFDLIDLFMDHPMTNSTVFQRILLGATQNGIIPLIKKLLDVPDLDLFDTFGGLGPLQYLCRTPSHIQIEITHIFLEDPRINDFFKPEIIRGLLKQVPNPYGLNPLLIDILSDNQFNLDTKFVDGTTPLSVACEEGHYECIEILVKKYNIAVSGAALFGLCWLHQTPDYDGRLDKYTETIGILLDDPKVDVNWIDPDTEYTSMIVICTDTTEEIFKMFLNHPNIIIDNSLCHDFTLFQYACSRYLSMETIRVLADDPRIDIHAKNNKGENVFQIVMEEYEDLKYMCKFDSYWYPQLKKMENIMIFLKEKVKSD